MGRLAFKWLKTLCFLLNIHVPFYSSSILKRIAPDWKEREKHPTFSSLFQKTILLKKNTTTTTYSLLFAFGYRVEC